MVRDYGANSAFAAIFCDMVRGLGVFTGSCHFLLSGWTIGWARL
jgi:hypothetical protein